MITSPYLRARETWRIAAEASGLPFPEPATDDRLVDRLLGDLEMLTRAAITQRFPDEEGRRPRRVSTGTARRAASRSRTSRCGSGRSWPT